MSVSSSPLIRVNDLKKQFGATRALDGLTLSIERGEIVALMGANGAGKSTLVNILAGAFSADAGSVTLAGKPYAPASPGDAKRRGVMTVHQSTDRIGAGGQSVADNLLLDDLANGNAGFFVSHRSVRKKAREVLAHSGFALPLDADFDTLGPADRQLVAIARALSQSPLLLILDEPTASLSATEAERLFGVLKGLKARGIAIIYISHRTADLQAIADRVVVLRGGVVAAQFTPPLSWDAAIEAMIGRPLESARAPQRQRADAPMLNLRQVRLLPHSPAFDLQVRRGEIVVVSGHLGAGKSRLLRSLFGLGAWAEGQVELDGTAYTPQSPQDAIAAGVGFAAEDRHRSSLMPIDWPGHSLAATIALPHLKRWFPSGWLRPSHERGVAEKAIQRLGIRTRSADASIHTLSGGNQQKVVLARWQSEPQKLLLLDEPFQGVDVGARAEIIAALRADRDTATLIATSDPEEALEVADRIFSISEHCVVPA